MNRRVLWIVLGCAFLFVGVISGFVFLLLLGIFKLMDRTSAHLCGLAMVQRSPAAAKLVGTPIRQTGFTGGRSNDTNGELNERITFNVAGPLGSAFVLAAGTKSPIASHLTVTIGREGRGETIYDGPFDCPELHAK
jgi:hypothetical protein